MRLPYIFKIMLVFLLVLPLTVACDSRSSTPPPDIPGPTQVIMATSEPTAEIAAAISVTAPVTQVPKPTINAEPSIIEPVEPDLRVDQLDAYLDNLTVEGSFMGSALVAQNGNILLNKGYGQANAVEDIPNQPDTQYRIGSLTKQFTAAAILKLQEQGTLDVQDPVAKFLPDYPRGNEISIHHLLTHSAGIPDYVERPDLQEVAQSLISLDELVETFSAQPLQFSPGERYQYSNSGYVVLTKIIEIASGQSYADYLENQILLPANMFSSGYDFLSPDLPMPAVGYHLTPGGLRPSVLTDSSWPAGAGALYGTTGDLYRWDRELNKDELLSSASLQAMFTPWIDTGEGKDYGYGWEIGVVSGRPAISHVGGIFGFASYIARFPDDDAFIIVLSNGIQMPPRVVAESLAQILFTNE